MDPVTELYNKVADVLERFKEEHLMDHGVISNEDFKELYLFVGTRRVVLNYAHDQNKSELAARQKSVVDMTNDQSQPNDASDAITTAASVGIVCGSRSGVVHSTCIYPQSHGSPPFRVDDTVNRNTVACPDNVAQTSVLFMPEMSIEKESTEPKSGMNTEKKPGTSTETKPPRKRRISNPKHRDSLPKKSKSEHPDLIVSSTTSPIIDEAVQDQPMNSMPATDWKSFHKTHVPCLKCKEVFSNKDDFIKHKKRNKTCGTKNSKATTFECSTCDDGELFSRDEFVEHVPTHLPNEPKEKIVSEAHQFVKSSE